MSPFIFKLNVCSPFYQALSLIAYWVVLLIALQIFWNILRHFSRCRLLCFANQDSPALCFFHFNILEHFSAQTIFSDKDVVRCDFLIGNSPKKTNHILIFVQFVKYCIFWAPSSIEFSYCFWRGEKWKKSEMRIGGLRFQRFLRFLTTGSTALSDRTQSKGFQISTKTLLLSNFFWEST